MVEVNEAIELADNGWAVLPLRGKVPRTPHGLLDATDDVETILAWGPLWTGANIGVKVPESLLALDVDPRNGGDVLTLGPLPPTLTCWSGRGDGGRHLYFLRPPGQLTSRGLPAGIDLKVNGYCVAPPSLHPSIRLPYVWEDRDPVPLPAHLREVLRVAAVVRGRCRVPCGDGRQLVAFVARQQLGNVNNGLYWAACRATDKALGPEVFEGLVDAAVSAGHPEPGVARSSRPERERSGHGDQYSRRSTGCY
jgi:hypothetical protein